MSHRRLNQSLAKAAARRGEDAMHTAMTLGLRLPILTTGLFAPTPASIAEWNRAYSEKVAATVAGAMAVNAAIGTAFWRNPFAVPMPMAAAVEALRLAEAGLAPARRRVRANARRLSKASK